MTTDKPRTPEDFMRRAITLSRERMRSGDGGPFAAIIVRDGGILAEGWNQVTSHNDPTAHAEIVAIRRACDAIDSISLEGAEIYATCEPCPMCMAAIYWARISRLYYANTTEDAEAIGFDDGAIYREIALAPEHRTMPAERLLGDEALEVFREWDAWPGKQRY